MKITTKIRVQWRLGVWLIAPIVSQLPALRGASAMPGAALFKVAAAGRPDAWRSLLR